MNRRTWGFILGTWLVAVLIVVTSILGLGQLSRVNAAVEAQRLAPTRVEPIERIFVYEDTARGVTCYAYGNINFQCLRTKDGEQ